MHRTAPDAVQATAPRENTQPGRTNCLPPGLGNPAPSDPTIAATELGVKRGIVRGIVCARELPTFPNRPLVRENDSLLRRHVAGAGGEGQVTIAIVVGMEVPAFLLGVISEGCSQRARQTQAAIQLMQQQRAAEMIGEDLSDARS